jgi:hypothetical protein
MTAEQESRIKLFLERVASIPDKKYSRHTLWVRGLGVQARDLLALLKKEAQ